MFNGYVHKTKPNQNQVSERVTTMMKLRPQKMLGSGELEEKSEGEDGEEPWGIDEYSAEGYAPP
jgi:hypothetical protein